MTQEVLFVIVPVIITLVVCIVVVFFVCVVVSATGVIGTVGGVAITHFLPPIVQANTVYVVFWIDESGHGT